MSDPQLSSALAPTPSAEEYTQALLGPSTQRTPGAQWVEQAVRTMWPMAKPPSVKDLAQTLDVSERHLMRVVKRETGKSLTEIRREIRMHHAKEAVVKSTTPIVQIARSFGYSTTSGFCRDFRRVFDCAPLQFRQNVKRMLATPDTGKWGAPTRV